MRDEIAEDGADTEGDADGLIRMLVHGLVRGFDALDRLLAHSAKELFAAFQCSGEAPRASLTSSPATSAVAATKARASSAKVPMSLLIACVCLFMFCVVRRCSLLWFN